MTTTVMRKKYQITITQMTDDSYGNKNTNVFTLETWAISGKKAISNVNYRHAHGSASEYPEGSLVINNYKAELAS